jgi:hypothetical protein
MSPWLSFTEKLGLLFGGTNSGVTIWDQIMRDRKERCPFLWIVITKKLPFFTIVCYDCVDRPGIRKRQETIIAAGID